MRTSPSVDVNIPLLGWTHIGGPSMHVLVALRDDDDMLLGASDAADSGDLDAVIDVLSQSGPRNAPSFVGVHTGDLTRVVAHGTTWVEVETPEGTRILTPPSARVWLDVDLEGAVDVVRLRGGALPAEAAALASLPAVPQSSSPSVPPFAHATSEPLGLVVPLPPTDAAGGGPRGWLSDAADAPSPAPSSPTTSFLADLPQWADHQPVLAGMPPAGPIVSASAASPPAPPSAAPPAAAGVVEHTLVAAPTQDGAGLSFVGTVGEATRLVPPAGVTDSTEVSAAPDLSAMTDLSAAPDVSAGPAASPDGAPKPAEASYDHLFGRTDDRDAYLAKLVALGDRDDRPADRDLDDPAPRSQSAPLLAPVSPRSSRSDEPPVSPGPSAGGSGLLISSVPWAAHAEPTGPGATPAEPPRTRDAPPPAILTPVGSAAPSVGAWPVPQVPGSRPLLPAPPMSAESKMSASSPTFYSGRRQAAEVAVTLSPDEAVSPVPGTPVSPDIPGTPDSPEASDEPSDELDDRTVDRSALLAHDQVTGPSVLGVLCPSGHPNPPRGGQCRRCSRQIAPQQPTAMARPSLGVLRLSSGDVVTLDRGVILGRAPQLPQVVPASSRPHVVRVASPRKDVSRTHLEVVLDDWQVLVHDLDTTNGTTVMIPGRPLLRLRPEQPVAIEPGTRISLADEVELTFEVGP